MSHGERHAEAVRLRDLGLTFKEIAKQMSLTPGGASSMYYKQPNGKPTGVVPGGPRKKAGLEAEALRYRTMGLTYEEIGKLLDVSRQRIHQILNPK